jgi:hypothetical protein
LCFGNLCEGWEKKAEGGKWKEMRRMYWFVFLVWRGLVRRTVREGGLRLAEETVVDLPPLVEEFLEVVVVNLYLGIEHSPVKVVAAAAME